MVISLLLVVALSIVGVALLIAPPPSATAGDSGSLLRLDPSLVASVAVAPAGAPLTSVIDRTGSGGWDIHIERDGSPLTQPWPAMPTQVRPMIRALCDLRDTSSGETTGLQTIDPALLVTITLSGGAEHRVRFDSTALGGRRLAEIDSRITGSVDDQLYRALTSPGPAGWRVQSPLSSIGGRTSRIAIRAPGEGPGVELARIDGVWRLRQPVQARADENAVTELLGAVGSLTIERFIDDPSVVLTGDTGLGSPRLLCRVEEDRRAVNPDDGQVRTETLAQTLTIGGPADLSGKLVYATIHDEQGNADTLVVLNVEPIASVSLRGERYCSPVAADSIRSNIGALSVRIAGQPEARFERGIDGWRLLDATGATIGDTDAAPIDTLLTALTETPATRLTTEAPDSYRPVASVTLYDFGGGPLETIEAGAIDNGALTLRSGQVFRIYEDVRTPVLLTPGGLR